MKKQWIIKELGQPTETAPKDGRLFFVGQKEALVKYDLYAPTAAKRMGALGRFVQINQQTGSITKFDIPETGEWFNVEDGGGALQIPEFSPDMVVKKSMSPEQLKAMWEVIKALANDECSNISDMRTMAKDIVQKVNGGR
jgi:hypothetical protein